MLTPPPHSWSWLQAVFWWHESLQPLHVATMTLHGEHAQRAMLPVLKSTCITTVKSDKWESGTSDQWRRDYSHYARTLGHSQLQMCVARRFFGRLPIHWAVISSRVWGLLICCQYEIQHSSQKALGCVWSTCMCWQHRIGVTKPLYL